MTDLNQRKTELTSKVKVIKSVKPYTNTHGTTYYYTLQMENGDVGAIGKKKENAYKIGDELNYTLKAKTSQTGNDYFVLEEIRPDNRNDFTNKTNTQSQRVSTFDARTVKEKNKAFALSYGKDIVVANSVSFTGATPDQMADIACSIADKFLVWLEK